MKLSESMEKALFELYEHALDGWIPSYSLKSREPTRWALKNRGLALYKHELLADYWMISKDGEKFITSCGGKK